MGFIRSLFAIFARIFLSAIFLASGVNKIIYWKEIEKHLLSILGDWQTHTVSSEMGQVFFGFAVIWTPVILLLATFLEILGGLLLLFGIKEKLGAALLILVLFPTTILIEPFWFAEGHLREMQLSLFLRDVAILGGLIVVTLNGVRGASSSPFSNDNMPMQ
jgi:uncharacterized membrane protein YphA (DoxX/SURF4 family)